MEDGVGGGLSWKGRHVTMTGYFSLILGYTTSPFPGETSLQFYVLFLISHVMYTNKGLYILSSLTYKSICMILPVTNECRCPNTNMSVSQ